ncbi:MAG: PAS domain S-box protein [Alphaproteobacteria bacterium]|nr:PAS domain S-box protein [Alphaproteobacteria bacterium]
MMQKSIRLAPWQPIRQKWLGWWRRQSPNRQDRLAMLGPLVAVVLFLAAIALAFAFLRYEEIGREQESVRRDVEYAQQRLRLRLIERQEQLLRLARNVAEGKFNVRQFQSDSNALINQYPEMSALHWMDANRRLRASASLNGQSSSLQRLGVDLMRSRSAEDAFSLARELQQAAYSVPIYRLNNGQPTVPTFQLHVPLISQGHFKGVILAEYSIDALMRYAVPVEITSRHAVSLLDEENHVLVGQTIQPKSRLSTPWSNETFEHTVPVSPIGDTLLLRAQAYRTSQGLVGQALFWLVAALSTLTVWMLIGTWRHTRRRLQTQRALIAETNFRRAMENSILTGMRALDMQGRITYVNAAFCQMTGWGETELVGSTPPYPYWPESDRDMLMKVLNDEISGRTGPSGMQVRVKRKDGTLFDARMYVSPLVDAAGVQTGWMTSMTDITEPNRIREQLSASYERFTTVLEALDASVSVAPLGSAELLFTNKMYRQWFGHASNGHLDMLEKAGMPEVAAETQAEEVDPLAGLPTEGLTLTFSENAEIYVPELQKWLEIRTRYLNWVDGRLAQMVIASDITPRRTAEELAAQQAERAQSVSRLITMGEMASSVAHELNQPLTAISNYCNGIVSRIKNRQISDEEMLHALEKTAHQAQRAGQIIQRIRSFVKRSEPNRSPTHVARMVSEAVELADIELRRQQVRLSYFVSSRLPPIMVDPILIEQVMINLLKNAGESINNAQRPAALRHVELQVLPRDIEGQNVVEFSVTDTGKGLSPQAMERLFEAFYSTKSEGMGIGLNLCRSIVESHQGRMQAENIYNGDQIQGCRFSFWIPVQVSTLHSA